MAEKKEGLVRAAAVEFEPDKVAVIGGEEIGTTPKKAPEEFQAGKVFNISDAEKLNVSPVVKEEAKKRQNRSKALKAEKAKESKEEKEEQTKQ